MDNEDNALSVIDGVEISVGEDGTMHFRPVDEKAAPAGLTCADRDTRSTRQKLRDWWNGLFIKPYVKIRDLADPFNDRTDLDAGSDGVKGVEVGIKIDF